MLFLLIAWLAIKSLIETRNIFSVLSMLCGVALGFGLSAPAWLAILDLVQGSARELQPAAAHWQWLVPPAALPGLILPCWTANWADFSSHYLPHAGTELACGLVASTALIAGLAWRGRALVRQIKWELVLLLLVLLLSMIPTAAVFSFGSRDLRGRSVAPATRIADPGYSGARSHRQCDHCDANAAYDWLVRLPADMDLSWARRGLVYLGHRAAPF